MKIIYSLALAMFWFANIVSAANRIDVNSLRDKNIQVIGFGSCQNEKKSLQFWDHILAAKPDLFVLAGDNVYADSGDPKILKESYALIEKNKHFQKFIKQVPLLATWDDHDFGLNDGGKEFAGKDNARAAFFDFFEVPENSERRKHSGVYDSVILGPVGQQVQIILLDTRYFRDQLIVSATTTKKKMYFEPNDDPQATFLGQEQWVWLEKQLLKKADIRVIVSSVQFIAQDHKREKWGNFPHERKRFLDFIRKNNVKGIVIVSGDRHYGRFYKMDPPEAPYTLFEMTTSGLNREGYETIQEKDRHSVTQIYQQNNFGLLRINWSQRMLTMELHLVNGGVKEKLEIYF